MPLLLGPLLGWFAGYLVSSIIFRFFIATGISFVSYYFINDLVTDAKDQFQNALYGLPSNVLSFIVLWKIDAAVSIIFSAYLIAAQIRTAKVFLGRS